MIDSLADWFKSINVTFFVLKYFSQEKYSANLKKWFYSVTADRACGSSFQVSWKISRRTSSFTIKLLPPGLNIIPMKLVKIYHSLNQINAKKKKERPKIWRFENYIHAKSNPCKIILKSFIWIQSGTPAFETR